MARSNSANAPSICIIMRPAGPAVSTASVSERKPAPGLFDLLQDVEEVFEERDSRSSFQTTTIRPAELIEQALQLGAVPAGRRRLLLEHPPAPGAASVRPGSGGVLSSLW